MEFVRMFDYWVGFGSLAIKRKDGLRFFYVQENKGLGFIENIIMKQRMKGSQQTIAFVGLVKDSPQLKREIVGISGRRKHILMQNRVYS